MQADLKAEFILFHQHQRTDNRFQENDNNEIESDKLCCPFTAIHIPPSRRPTHDQKGGISISAQHWKDIDAQLLTWYIKNWAHRTVI